MIDRPRSVSSLAALLAAVLCLTAPRAAAAAPPPQPADAVLYRIFLTGGATLSSYGDYARVGDHVVFSMPLGDVLGGQVPPLKLVTIPADTVDWPTTERYAASARAAHYAATRGPADFAKLTGQVAWALNAISHTKDPADRLDLARRAQAVLNDWNQTSYGYRAKDAAELTALVDEVVSGLRAARGADQFQLNFVAHVAPPPSVPLMPAPSAREQVEQMLAAARLTPDPGDRLGLLRSAVALLDAHASALPPSFVAATRGRAAAELATEVQTERAYGDLRAHVLETAAERARSADVRGLQDLIRTVLSADDRLGHRRPNAMSALLSTLDRKLDAARRLRLARDQWALRATAYRAYRKQIDRTLRAWSKVRPALEDVRALAGPAPRALARAEVRVGEAQNALAAIVAPEGLRRVHAMLASAFQLAGSASRMRRQAVSRADMHTAWNASAAAAGALMLFTRAHDALDKALEPPELQ
jgi:hypothetical protein